MAPTNWKNNQEDIATDRSLTSSTGSSVTDSGSSFAIRSTPSTSHRSRRDSFDSSDGRSSRSTCRRSNRFSSGSRSSSSGSATRKISSRRLSHSKKLNKSPKKAVRPIGEISMLKHPLKTEVRSFLSQYASAPDFEAFSLSVDGIPFVALSLMNADKELLEMLQVPPPTPMKKQTPGVNSPRKRSHSLHSRSSIGSKHVSFADEESPPKKSKKSMSDERVCGFEKLVKNDNDS